MEDPTDIFPLLLVPVNDRAKKAVQETRNSHHRYKLDNGTYALNIFLGSVTLGSSSTNDIYLPDAEGAEILPIHCYFIYDGTTDTVKISGPNLAALVDPDEDGPLPLSRLSFRLSTDISKYCIRPLAIGIKKSYQFEIRWDRVSFNEYRSSYGRWKKPYSRNKMEEEPGSLTPPRPDFFDANAAAQLPPISVSSSIASRGPLSWSQLQLLPSHSTTSRDGPTKLHVLSSYSTISRDNTAGEGSRQAALLAEFGKKTQSRSRNDRSISFSVPATLSIGSRGEGTSRRG